MAKVVSNKQQLKRLVELLRGNLNIAQGICTKTNAQKKWEEFAVELNKIGPPQREWHKWMRVWADLKCKIKKKNNRIMYQNGVKIDENTLNLSRHFSELEEMVINMLGFNKHLSQFQQDYEFDDTKMTDSTEDNEKYGNIDFDDEIMKLSTSSPTIFKNEPEEEYSSIMDTERKSNFSMDKYKIILEDQNLAQKQFYNKMIDLMGDMKRSMSNMEDYIKKGVQQKDDLIELKRLKLKAYKENKINQTVYSKSKIRYKNELLAIKKMKQNAMNGGKS
ncbi:uncharacterized protein LOC129911423 [Episyrphus balteatus]|uniref:uncharacterized protein LOC129911423 n=1 Tax=Episyrphus balteatus TaxID=286459 RepID=UPI0024859861|nr:uncharacterized protein LOC129911423 [Episyrphus balteatus]